MSTTLARIGRKRFTVKHYSTDCDTTNVPMCLYHGKVVPIKLMENPPHKFIYILIRVGKQIKICSRHSSVTWSPNMCYLCKCEICSTTCFWKSTKAININWLRLFQMTWLNMSLLPSCFSVLKMYIQRLYYQVFPMKTSQAFQIWTECVENKWEGYRLPLSGRKLDFTITKEPQNYISHFVCYNNSNLIKDKNIIFAASKRYINIL